MHEVLLNWLITKSQSYKETVTLHDKIESLVMKEHDSGFPAFISQSRDELEYQDTIWPLNYNLTYAKDKTPYSWAKPAFQQLRESTRLFENIPYHTLFSMVGIRNNDTPYSIRCSEDIPSKNKLEKLLEKYVDSINKTKQEIEILAKKLGNSKYSEEEIGKIINKYSLADEIEL